MRIAIFSESYEPVVNGVSVVVAMLRDGLRARGHEVTIYASHFPGYKDGEGVLRFPSRMTKYAPGYPLAIPYAPKLRNAFFSNPPDIVHTQTPFLLGYIGMKWAKCAGVPIVSTNHTLYTEYTHYVPVLPGSITRSALVRWMRWYYQRCDSIVVPSGPVSEVLHRYGVEKPIHVIKSGVTTKQVDSREDFRKAYGISPDTFVLLYVGRIAREKNLELILKSFRAAQESCSNVKLMIVGSGPYEEEFRQLVGDLGVSKNVVFTGVLDHKGISSAYSAADAFVFSSLTDTQGLVLCEALTTGLPCVAVGAGGVPEVLEDGVDSILTENSVDDFSKAICKLVRTPDFRAKLAAGAIQNSAKYTVDAMAERFEKYYLSEIERKRG